MLPKVTQRIQSRFCVRLAKRSFEMLSNLLWREELVLVSFSATRFRHVRLAVDFECERMLSWLKRL